jgi:DNA-binding IclR family transcriptional regulator
VDAERDQPSNLPRPPRSAGGNGDGQAGAHQTVTRVTRILEQVVYRPGSTYAELTRTLGAPKSSVYGFIRGLLAVDWLFEDDHRLYLGPAFYSLAIASGHIRAGMVTAADLDALYREAGLTAFVGVRAGDHLIYIAEAGSNLMASFEAQTDIRRGLLTTAGGKALLAALSEPELHAYLRRRQPEEQADVDAFLEALPAIRESKIAINVNPTRSRTGIATVIRGAHGHAVASVTLVGPTSQVLPRVETVSELLRQRVEAWRERSTGTTREPV